jgi:hypothetical protein
VSFSFSNLNFIAYLYPFHKVSFTGLQQPDLTVGDGDSLKILPERIDHALTDCDGGKTKSNESLVANDFVYFNNDEDENELLTIDDYFEKLSDSLVLT